MNSEKGKTSETHVLILKLTDKLHLRRGDKSIVLSPTWNVNLNYQMNYHILYQIFKVTLSIFKKKHGENFEKPSIRIYVNKIENRVTFIIKTGYYLELLTAKTMKLLGTT